MLQLRSVSVGLVLGLALSLAQGCGQEPCGPAWCGGCCDSAGQCLGGEAADACGSGGAACGACDASLVCQAGSCVTPVVLDPDPDAGTEAPTAPLDISATIAPNPAVIGSNTMDVFIRGANGVLVPGATITPKTWMPAMGHGSPTPTVSELGAGEYKVSAVRFTMGGTWTVTLTVATPGGLTGTKVFSYTAH